MSPEEMIYICPACGARYNDPTTCTASHEPTSAIQYDRATVERADAGDVEAVKEIADQELAATGGMAGVIMAESTPAGSPQALPAPVAAESVGAAVAAAPAAPVEAPVAVVETAELSGDVEAAILNATDVASKKIADALVECSDAIGAALSA